MFLHWLSEWQGLTGVVESPCECLLHFHSFWSKVIRWGFVSDTSFSLFPFSQAHFAVHTFCVLSPNSHAVKFNYGISFHTQGNYGAGLIAVNSASCQWSHHTAVTVTIWPHWNCTEPHNHLQSLAALFTILICMPHFIPVLLSVNV